MEMERLLVWEQKVVEGQLTDLNLMVAIVWEKEEMSNTIDLHQVVVTR